MEKLFISTNIETKKWKWIGTETVAFLHKQYPTELKRIRLPGNVKPNQCFFYCGLLF